MFRTGTAVQFPANTYDDNGQVNGTETLSGRVIERSQYEGYTRVLTEAGEIVTVPDDDLIA